jgi:hypothetical protein
MITRLKEAAMQHNLKLNPANIYVDFEQGAIKAFKFHFPSALKRYGIYLMKKRTEQLTFAKLLIKK